MLAYLRSLFSRTPSATSLTRFSPSTASTLPARRRVMAPKDLVEKAIAENQITVFSKSWCPYCTKAKALLSEKFPDAKTIIYELDEMEDGSEIQTYLKSKTGQGTVPNIFVAQNHIGGCDDTVAAAKSGRIAGLLKA